MGGNIISVVIASIKAKIMPLVTKLRRWTSWSYVRNQIIIRIRNFFLALFNVKPRNKDDYYGVFGWLVSKRLAFAVVVVVGVLSLYYLMSAGNLLSFGRTAGVPTYSYRSLLLRFASGDVRIKGKDGYLAYDGQVDDGHASGSGTLYNREGVVVYKGAFSNSKYEGKGTRYYDTGSVYYTGDFSQNEFNGSGTLYRENGSLEYKGEFAQGKKDGQGDLYDKGSNLVYTGGFSEDELLYSDFLGKKVSEVASSYKGVREMYEADEEFVVLMKDIGALYQAQSETNTLDEESQVEQVTVLKNYFMGGEKKCKTIDDLREYFGEEVYEGNSEITLPEAVGVNWLADQDDGPDWTVQMQLRSEYDDYSQITSWDDSHDVYLYSFRKEGLIYNFVCEDREGGFLLYSMEQEEGGETAE